MKNGVFLFHNWYFFHDSQFKNRKSFLLGIEWISVTHRLHTFLCSLAPSTSSIIVNIVETSRKVSSPSQISNIYQERNLKLRDVKPLVLRYIWVAQDFIANNGRTRNWDPVSAELSPYFQHKFWGQGQVTMLKPVSHEAVSAVYQPPSIESV